MRREVDVHVRARLSGLTELQLDVLDAAARLADRTPDGTAIARELGRRASSDIGSTLQWLVTKRLLRLEPKGYRVVSRALARDLANR